MFLYLGKDVTVRARDVVGAFDMEATTVSQATRGFLARCEADGRVTNVSDGLPKLFVLCVFDGEPHVFVTSITMETFRKRAKGRAWPGARGGGGKAAYGGAGALPRGGQ
jgi:hypothetical protein